MDTQELSKRIRALAPEKRKLFARLLKEKGLSSSLVPREFNETEQGPNRSANIPREVVTDEDPDADDNPLSLSLSSSPADVKAMNRRFYNSVSKQLDSALFGSYSFFLNFGYVANSAEQHSRIKLPPHYLNRNCAKLIAELVADCVLSERHLLDVGCGRGGTIHTIHRFYHPRVIVGMDLSSIAIAFCKRTHQNSEVSFLEGDAERLPFRNETFDVVTNIESSHSYPSIPDFYKNVFRVLKPGGNFLYTDLFGAGLVRERIKLLREIGFILEQERDVTANVLLSCDETARTHLNAFSQKNDTEVINNFLGVPGSQVYDEMKSGRSTYRIFKLAKMMAA